MRTAHRRGWLFFAIFLLVFGAWWVFRMLNKPNTGVIAPASPAPMPEPVKEKSWLPFVSTNLRFSYPYEFSPKAVPEEVRPPVLERIVLNAADAGVMRKIAITVEKLPIGGMREHPSFRFRELHPEVYQRVAVPDQKKSGVFFSKEGEMAEITGFFTDRTRLVTVALSGSNMTVEALRPTYERLIEGLDWPK